MTAVAVILMAAGTLLAIAGGNLIGVRGPGPNVVVDHGSANSSPSATAPGIAANSEKQSTRPWLSEGQRNPVVVVPGKQGSPPTVLNLPWAGPLAGSERFVTDQAGTHFAVLPRSEGGQGAVVISDRSGGIEDFGSLDGRFQAPTAVDIRGIDEGRAVLVLHNADIAPVPEAGGLVMEYWTWEGSDYELTSCRLVVPESFQEIDYSPMEGSCESLPTDWPSHS